MGRHVLACLLDAPSGLVPVLPRADSYQRLVDNCWVPRDDGWAFEHRLSNIRFIAPLQWPSRRPHGSKCASWAPAASHTIRFQPRPAVGHERHKP
ncbi:uncharacterized protein SPSK_10132 [Sporothrix schenckii 1099-18]|uniref:Uncharacterized protein n=1 Tax=Sporothrix schenckii 1099-18 TaxID=1397361 RepID=A0A0F2M8L9_SPOSC|nr:uncharacterized protein SPSK_10132 [Sporothrix schenckii 1099-18]KJR85170.1 hypothetical protein SPSK_10132 [Sporothrix schenckii 1099-18]